MTQWYRSAHRTFSRSRSILSSSFRIHCEESYCARYQTSISGDPFAGLFHFEFQQCGLFSRLKETLTSADPQGRTNPLSQEIRKKLREYIQGTLSARGDMENISDSDSLFMSGRLNSIDTVETVIFLEENYGFDFEKVGFDQGHIDTIDVIVLLLARTPVQDMA